MTRTELALLREGGFCWHECPCDRINILDVLSDWPQIHFQIWAETVKYYE